MSIAKILCVALSAILVLSCILLCIFGQAYLTISDSFGIFVMTILVFVILLVTTIFVAVRADEQVTAGMIVLSLLSLLLLVVPIRCFMLSSAMQNAFEHTEVELVEYKQGVQNREDCIVLGLKFTNKTGVSNFSYCGKISFYIDDQCIASYDDLSASSGGEENISVAYYYLTGESLYYADYSKLSIIFTFESVTDGTSEFTFDPVEVNLK